MKKRNLLLIIYSVINIICVGIGTVLLICNNGWLHKLNMWGSIPFIYSYILVIVLGIIAYVVFFIPTPRSLVCKYYGRDNITDYDIVNYEKLRMYSIDPLVLFISLTLIPGIMSIWF